MQNLSIQFEANENLDCDFLGEEKAKELRS